MEQIATYADVAEPRADEVVVRIGLGAFVGAVAWLLAPGWLPLAWWVAMIAGQLVDRWIAAPIIGRTDDALSPGRKSAYLASTFLSAMLFTGINAYLWLRGGQTGQWFALLVGCGGLVHVSLKHYAARPLLLASGAPHALVLFVLPIVNAIQTPQRDGVATAAVLAGGLLYVAHLAAATRQSELALASLRAANAEAVTARRHAERASEAKSAFLATVSHEIRTPMNAVLAAAHLLRRTPLTPEQAEHVAMLTSGGEVLTGLVNDVLDISKIEAGKMVLDEADLEVDEALGSLVRLWEPQARAKGLNLVLEAAADLPRAIRTDPLRLRQILFNLLSNAVKFTDQGLVSLRAGVDGARLWFEVEDTGCGVDEDTMGRLFGNFEQAHGENHRPGGAGLGLAISRRLAGLMGGDLTVESTPGRGSVFRLELPLMLSEAVPSAAVDMAAAASDTALSILVVDDHAMNRRIVGLFLEPLGWRLTMAEDGGEGVEAARRERFDAILMDMQMPVMNGVDAALAIRASAGPNAATPIIALTANALGHHRDQWDEAGVAAFLTKPIDPALLVSTIVDAIRPAASDAARAA